MAGIPMILGALRSLLAKKQLEAGDKELQEGKQGSLQEHDLNEKQEAPKKDSTRDLRGAGVKAFKDVDEASLQLFTQYLLSMKEQEQGEEKVQDTVVSLEAGTTVDKVQLDIPDNQEIHVDDKTHQPLEEEVSNSKAQISLAVLLAIGFASYLGIRLVTKGGQVSIEVANEDALMKEFEKLPEEVKTVSFTSADVSGIEYSQGTIYERLGVQGYRKTSDFMEKRGSRYHKGVDIATPINTPIRAPFAGTITFVAYARSKAGTYVEMVSEDGTVGLRLLHLNSVPVVAGQNVKQGDIIAYSGNSFGGSKRDDGTDWSSGAHLHLEVKSLSKRVKTGTSIFNKGSYLNPDLFGASRATTVSPAATTIPEIIVQYNKPTAIGTEGKNLWSIRGGDSASDPWLGKTGTVTGKAGGFASFETYAHGARAGAITLLKYQLNHDVSNSGGSYTTIADIASNDKHSYLSTANGDNIEQWINTVSRESGFAKDEKIDLTQVDTLARVMKGIAFEEHSARVQDTQIAEVIRHFSIVENIKSNVQ